MKRLLVLVTAALVASSAVFADESAPVKKTTYYNNIALQLGYATLTNQGGTSMAYGLAYTYTIAPSWRIGLYTNTTSPTTYDANNVRYFGTNTIGGGVIKYAWGSWRAGVIIGSAYTNPNNSTQPNSSSTVVGPSIDYDIPWMDRWALGVQVSDLFNLSQGSYSQVNTVGILKYKF